uniref:Ankyrin repeat domain 37 n=1 Tax=Cyprinus carpio TaxID=7962 RepID=A0A8C2H348_CYPCA
MLFVFHCISIQLDCMSNLFESGFAVNGGLNGPGQSPAHLAACGGQAFCLLWLLRTGADQEFLLKMIMASDAHFDICNNAGQTAEDIAWSCGFDECGRFLNMHRRTRDLKNTSLSSLSERHTLSSTLTSGGKSEKN